MRKFTQEEIIQKANLIHGNQYDYSLFFYKHMLEKSIIICKIHGEFIQTVSKHLIGQGCPKCKNIKIKLCKTKTLTHFITKSIEIHMNRYDYSKFIYINAKIKGIIICPIHGEFLQNPNHHLLGKGCPICKLSKGELKIKKWLNVNNINNLSQHKFKDCRGKKYSLSFDFYLPDHNICIEFDGEQHFKPMRRSKNQNINLQKFNDIIMYDKIKEEYCFNNNIHLIRIPYTKYDNIENILQNALKISNNNDH